MGEEPFEGRVAEEATEAASATECTGLIPALPQTDAQGDHSAALCAVHRPKRVKKRRRNG